MSNSEDLKKMREALSDYYELARKLRDDEIREAGYAEDEHEGMLRAEEAIHLFDAHITDLSQQEAVVPSDCADKYIPVSREAVDWLKEKFPAMCVKSGMCEQIGGRLYTKTISSTHPQPQKVESSWKEVECPGHKEYAAALYRHQPKSHNQSPIAHVWDDNNGFGGSPSRRVEFEYPRYFHGPVTKLYDHASPIDVKTIMAELRSHCESNNELVPEQSIYDTLLSTEKMMGREASKPASHPIEPSPQPVASVPQDVEEFIKSNGFEVSHTSGVLITAPDFLDFMAGKVLVPVEPTAKMIDATFNDEIETSGEIESHNARNRRIYKAMLTASKEEPHND